MLFHFTPIEFDVYDNKCMGCTGAESDTQSCICNQFSVDLFCYDVIYPISVVILTDGAIMVMVLIRLISSCPCCLMS